MKYTESAIGILTRQYKSVLKKCLLINMGLFALGAINITPALAEPITEPTTIDTEEVRGDIDISFISSSTEISEPSEELSGEYLYNKGTVGNINGEVKDNTITASGEEGFIGSLIANEGTIQDIESNFTGNKFQMNSSNLSGAYGMLSNIGKIGNINGDFKDNTLSTHTKQGGIYSVIFNTESGTIGDINSNFIHNTLDMDNEDDANTYGLIANLGYIDDDGNIHGKMGNITGDFINNTVKLKGGANTAGAGGIANAGEMGDITGNFTGNTFSVNIKGTGENTHPEIPGFIANVGGKMGNIEGDFSNNTMTMTATDVDVLSYGFMTNMGGEIGDIKGDFSNNTLTATSTDGENSAAFYGFITNSEGEMGDIKGDFTNNTMTMSGKAAFTYGMLFNNGSNGATVGNITGDYKNNTITATGIGEGSNAAVYTLFYSDGTMGDISGEYSNNSLTATSDETSYSYGLILNMPGMGNIINSSFKDNTVKAIAENGEGVAGSGAIFSIGDLTMIAKDGYESIISGNYVEDNRGRRNEAIVLMKPYEEGTADLTLRTETGGSLTIDDQITGSPYISNDTKRDDETGKRYYVDENGKFFTDDEGNKLAETNELGTLVNPDDVKLLDATFSTANITGDGTGTVRLHNDINNLHTNVSNTMLDIGTSTVNVKDITFESDSTLALRINGFEDEEHGRLNATDSMTIKDGAKLSATLSQKAMADSEIGDSEEVTLLTVQNESITNNSFIDGTSEEDVKGNPLEVGDNNMYKFEKKEDGSGTYVVTKIADAKTIADDEESSATTGENAWVGDAAGAWVDNSGYAEGSAAADVADKLADLAQNDATGLVHAVKALAPTETAVVQTQTSEEATRLFKTVDAHLRGERDAMGISSGDELQDVSMWGKVYVGESKISNRGSIPGSDADSRGVIMGVEKKLDNTKKVGFGLQYDSTDINAYSRKVDVSSLSGFAYGEYKPSQWFVNGVASYGQSHYDEDKFALGGVYNAKYDVHVASLAAMTGYQFGYLTPEAGLRYYHIMADGYTDTAGQSVKEDKADILRGVAGVRMAKDFDDIRPEVYLGVTYDIASDKNNTTVNLANGTSYTVPGKRLSRLGMKQVLVFQLQLMKT